MNGTGSTSQSLLARARRREPVAWARLTQLYEPLIQHWCRRSRVREADIPDVVQEVFRSVAANLRGFRRDRPGDSFRGWLYRITRNKVLDHFRRIHRQPRATGGTEFHESLQQIPFADDRDKTSHGHEDPSASTDLQEERILRVAMTQALREVRGQVTERSWQAFWIMGIERRTAEEAAAELGMSAGAVRVAKCRVLQKLRAAMGESD